MKYTIIYSNRFEKSLKKSYRRGLDIERLREVLRLLENGEKLPPKYKAHKLVGKYSGAWECHIRPDWLLVWEQNDTELILLLVETGTHADIFG